MTRAPTVPPAIAPVCVDARTCGREDDCEEELVGEIGVDLDGAEPEAELRDGMELEVPEEENVPGVTRK